MRYFPLFMDLDRQDVLVVGAGGVAERKARLLLEAGAKVRVVARHLNERFERWRDNGEIAHVATAYSADCLADARLVFAATSDADLNRRVFGDAEQRRIPVNVVDEPRHCRFISPAIVDRSPVLVAISTGGAAPLLARRLRTKIEKLLPLGLGRVAAAAGRLRKDVNRALPSILRKDFWETQFADDRLLAWSTSSTSEIARDMRSAMRIESNQSEHRGRVYLVGAGPGNPELLTLKALNVLGEADVILHDRLVSEDILELARRDAKRIDVGKRAGRHHRSQREIHSIMLAEANKGHTVVRLKGGDAFVFGRGGEELEFLSRHGVDYEVVPGITAALGCAAFAGVPLTHREHAQALTFVTGHLSATADEGDGEDRSPINWSGVAGPGRTAVVYMGLRQAGRIRKELLQEGISGSTPVMIIADGTRDTQQVIEGSVEWLAVMAQQVRRRAPALLIIGQVAALGSNLAWFHNHQTFRTAA